MKVKVATSPEQQQFEEVDLTLTTKRGSECLIGRSSDSDLVLDSDDVSRLHAKFFSQGGRYYFCDTGSRNGSIVNGKLAEKNQSYMLQNGDIIRIGDFVLMLEDDNPEPQQAETVVRIINPPVFFNKRQDNIKPQQPKQSESTFTQPEEVSAPNNIVELEHEQTGAEHQEHLILDVTTEEPENQIPEHTEESSTVQVNDNNTQNQEPENQIPEHTEESSTVQANDNDTQNQELENQIPEHTEESSTVQASDNDTQNQELKNQIPEHTEESSTVQANDNDIQNQELEKDGTEHQEYLASDVTTEPKNQIPEQETEDIEEPEKAYVQIAKIIEEKQIVLICHETKKSELTQLVSEHEQFLSYCLTRTWQNFSDELYKQTSLSVTQEIPPPNSGGYQTINSLVNSNEILAVIFLRDLMVPQPGQASEEALLRICNINNVLLATNFPTAQAVIHFLKNLKD